MLAIFHEGGRQSDVCGWAVMTKDLLSPGNSSTDNTQAVSSSWIRFHD